MRSLYELAIQQPLLDMPELLWKVCPGLCCATLALGCGIHARRLQAACARLRRVLAAASARAGVCRAAAVTLAMNQRLPVGTAAEHASCAEQGQLRQWQAKLPALAWQALLQHAAACILVLLELLQAGGRPAYGMKADTKPKLRAQAYIDFEISQRERGRTRALYERLLDRTKHVKARLPSRNKPPADRAVSADCQPVSQPAIGLPVLACSLPIAHGHMPACLAQLVGHACQMLTPPCIDGQPPSCAATALNRAAAGVDIVRGV